MEFEIKRTSPTHQDFQFLVRHLDAELANRYGKEQENYTVHNIIDHAANVVLVYDADKPVACGCFRRMDDEGTVEIKRMFTLPSHRGQGLAKKVVAELEKWAIEEKCHTAKLETGIKQPEAAAAYIKSGYSLIDNYGPYVNNPNSICMHKSLR